MLKSKSKGISHDGLKVRGFFRVQLTEDGKGVVGDSGWKENAVTDLGVQYYLITWLCNGTGSKWIQYMALGTGSQPGASDTTLNGEIFHKSGTVPTNSRAAVSSSIIASHTAQFTAAFLSADSFVTATANISNVGLFNDSLTSLANNGTLFAGNTYTSSSCATNQSVCQEYWRTLNSLNCGNTLIKQLRQSAAKSIYWRRSETIIRTPVFYRMMG